MGENRLYAQDNHNDHWRNFLLTGQLYARELVGKDGTPFPFPKSFYMNKIKSGAFQFEFDLLMLKRKNYKKSTVKKKVQTVRHNERCFSLIIKD